MIIITGPGRSGTSVVAHMYRELGFDPGGRWNPEVRAGLEAPEIRDINHSIARDLGITLFGQRRPPRPLRRLVKRIPFASLRASVNRGLRRFGTPARLVSRPRWDQTESIVEEYGHQLRELARSHSVVKDPRFCWTLRIWTKAGAQIDHVLVCVRALDSMVHSRIAAEHVPAGSENSVRDSLVYSLGLCMVTIYEYGLSHDVVLFPDFLQSPDDLFQCMRFPRSVSRERFLEAFSRVVKQDFVHESS